MFSVGLVVETRFDVFLDSHNASDNSWEKFLCFGKRTSEHTVMCWPTSVFSQSANIAMMDYSQREPSTAAAPA